MTGLPATAAVAAPPRPGWRTRLRKWGPPVLGLVVLGLLASNAHRVDWRGAWQALQRYPAMLLLGALGIALASHALYGCFDLIGKRYVRHRLPVWRTWVIAVVSYAFNLNLGSLVGGVAMRARLYLASGLGEASVVRIVSTSLATNWLGYALLAGGLFASGVLELPERVRIGDLTLRCLGGLLVAIALGYVAACAWLVGRSWSFRGHRVTLPGPALALAQLALSATNWALMGSTMYLLLGGQVPFSTTLAVLLAASIAGVVTPIPAGLGVLEAVYLTLLDGELRQSTLMGAVLAYRAVYYLLPLGLGVLGYLALERYNARHPDSTA